MGSPGIWGLPIIGLPYPIGSCGPGPIIAAFIEPDMGAPCSGEPCIGGNVPTFWDGSSHGGGGSC